MAGRVAPYIDNTGLVFAYDQSNTVRSYLGEPTTNVVNTNGQNFNPLDLYTWASSGNTSTWSRDTAAEPSPVGGIPLKEVSSGTDSYSSTYNNLTNSLGAASAGQTWTVSVYAKAVAGTNLQLWLFEANSSGGYVAISADSFTATGNWQRLVITRTLTDGTTAAVQARVATSTNGGVIWWDGLQMEQKAKATQFTAGTRSATQGLKDLTGRSTIDLSNVSFDSNVQMTFDGTNDLITLADAAHLRFSGGSFTIEQILTVSSISSKQRTFSKGSSGWSRGWHAAIRPTQWEFELSDGISTPGNSFLINTATTVGTNHVAWVIENAATAKLYVNGVQVGSTQTITESVDFATTTSTVGIGAFESGGEYFNGKIPYTKLYARALSASEIQQNFNAVKGRYGI